MAKYIDLTGKTIGIWKVLSRTSERTEKGAVLYKCMNTKTKKTEAKSSGYLIQFMKRGSRKTTPGRKRKWIIIKKPYIEIEKA